MYKEGFYLCSPSCSGVDYGHELSWAVLMDPLVVVLTMVINSLVVVSDTVKPHINTFSNILTSK